MKQRTGPDEFEAATAAAAVAKFRIGGKDESKGSPASAPGSSVENSKRAPKEIEAS